MTEQLKNVSRHAQVIGVQQVEPGETFEPEPPEDEDLKKEYDEQLKRLKDDGSLVKAEGQAKSSAPKKSNDRKDENA